MEIREIQPGNRLIQFVLLLVFPGKLWSNVFLIYSTSTTVLLQLFQKDKEVLDNRAAGRGRSASWTMA